MIWIIAFIFAFIPFYSFQADPSCTCGKKNVQRIVGGEEAIPNEFPWQVAIIIWKYYLLCGGSVISKDWILTASHCTDNRVASDLSVTLGEHNLADSSDGNINIDVSDIIMHESYNSTSFNNDIALLKLSTPATFSYVISPVCLPFNYVSTSLSSKIGIVSGWGDTAEGGSLSKVLKKVEIPYLTTEECQNPQYGYGTTYINNNMICTYREGEDSCQGDSGGPLFWANSNGIYFQMGIVSFGAGCARKDRPGVYVKVTNYLDWIKEKTGAANEFCVI